METQAIQSQESQPPASNPYERYKKRIGDKLKKTVTFWFLLSSAFYLYMVILGAKNVHRCPVEPFIPIFLIISGICGITSKLLKIFGDFLLKYCPYTAMLRYVLWVDVFMVIIGTYWVYKEYKPSYHVNDVDFCDKTTYLFAFIYLTVFYSFLMVTALCFCCLCCLIDADDDEATGKSGDQTVGEP